MSKVKKLDPVPPGEILAEEFMKPNRISQNRLARDNRHDEAPSTLPGGRETDYDDPFAPIPSERAKRLTMNTRWVFVSLVACLVIALPAALSAQTRPPSAPKAKQAPLAPEPDDVEELTPAQIKRAQEPDTPRGQNAAAAPKPQAQPAHAVSCGTGAFAKDSSHLKLAMLFGSQNITFAEVDGPDASRIMASVLYPKDPKRRLEVLWQDDAARNQTSVIVINGQSTWTAPKGLHLGLPLAALEKLNGKPFKLKGFDKDGGSVTDWQGGALEQLQGGCKIGVRLAPDPKAAPDARSGVASSEEFVSSDAKIRTVRPAVAEIIVGY
jgi:hypothetical protein